MAFPKSPINQESSYFSTHLGRFHRECFVSMPTHALGNHSKELGPAHA
jgi:hypothetical protein